MKSCFMFGHADCPDSMLPKIEEAIPIVYENGDTPRISWDKNPTVESVVCLSREKADDYIRISVHTEDLKVRTN